MSLGQALKQLRKKQGLTLADLAEQTQSHVGNLSRIERGAARPSLDLLYRIAQALGFSITDVFSVAENRHLNPRQVALNAIFISLLEEDQLLLLEFAELLAKRTSRPHGAIHVDTRELPVDSEEENQTDCN
ncbi:helix-turn-helix domain-containing protein [Marinobacter sp.]|uniref:helix-turn-helix domain-containing protein n=1 Tax=Marinobacter sp. TaxID=50741 RepID=UPI0035C6AFAE